MELAQSLVIAVRHTFTDKKRGRSFSNSKQQLDGITQKRYHSTQEIRPYNDIRFDNIDHMPQHDQKTEPTRCKQVKAELSFFVINEK